MSVRQVTKLVQVKNLKFFVHQRSITGCSKCEPHPLLSKYKQFQTNDGIPVHQKGGFGDRIMFQITILLTVIGLFDGFVTLFSMAFKKKK